MRRLEVRWGSWLILAALLCAGPVLAADDDYEKISIRVTLTHLSDACEDVEPGARSLVDQLERNKIRYKCARVVREVALRLAPGDSDSVKVAEGRKAHLQLMQVDDNGALVAVDVDGGVKVDAKVRRGGRGFVLDVGKVGDGKRVLEIAAD